MHVRPLSVPNPQGSLSLCPRAVIGACFPSASRHLRGFRHSPHRPLMNDPLDGELEPRGNGQRRASARERVSFLGGDVPVYS